MCRCCTPPPPHSHNTLTQYTHTRTDTQCTRTNAHTHTHTHTDTHTHTHTHTHNSAPILPEGKGHEAIPCPNAGFYMTFTNVLKNLIAVWNVKQAVGLHCI